MSKYQSLTRHFACRMTMLILLLATYTGRCRCAEETPDNPSPDNGANNPGMKTLGGMQFWGDVLFFREYSIQQNAITGHYRLLDGDNYRLASGTYDECVETLEKTRTDKKLSPMSGKAVILAHGIVRSSRSMKKLRQPLEDAGYTVFLFDYPSTRLDIPAAAEYLHRAISSLEGIEEINLVVHSMGGLVVRAYLKEHRDARIQRMVMMGVPNGGARMADHLKRNVVFKLVLGPAGQQLVSDPEGLIPLLPTPEFEFGVIAGCRGTLKGYNPLIPGDDDGTVSVNSTRLPGASDFLTVRALHTLITGNREAIEATVRFLETGAFREDGSKHPIPPPVADGSPRTETENPTSEKPQS